MKMPSISIMTMVLGGKLADGSLTDVGMLQALERMGFDGIEVFSNHLLSKPGLLDAYAAYLAGSSLRVTCVDGGCNFIGADPASRAKGVDDLRAAIDAVLAGGSVDPNQTPSIGCNIKWK